MTTPLSDLATTAQITLGGKPFTARVLSGDHLCEFDGWVRAKNISDAARGKGRCSPDDRELVTDAVAAYLREPLNTYRMLDFMQSFPGANWVIVKALTLAGTAPADLDTLLAGAHPRELGDIVCQLVPMWRRVKEEQARPTPEEATTT